ncbi:hypothetical protein ABIE59_003608 [Marinobacter sp. MBR-99]|jgi:hypothetical protein|nr:hypothetical protein MTMN5_04000 [Marinobacter salarius]
MISRADNSRLPSNHSTAGVKSKESDSVGISYSWLMSDPIARSQMFDQVFLAGGVIAD